MTIDPQSSPYIPSLQFRISGPDISSSTARANIYIRITISWLQARAGRDER